jgi:hypothetical protein
MRDPMTSSLDRPAGSIRAGELLVRASDIIISSASEV